MLDHLAPECFAQQYDGSGVDCWSLGTIVCLLLTGNTPFVVPSSVDCKESEYDLVIQWKCSEERRMLPDEMRSLLDNVFTEAHDRIHAWEICKDIRLTVDAKEFVNKKATPYYRIDLATVSS